MVIVGKTVTAAPAASGTPASPGYAVPQGTISQPAKQAGGQITSEPAAITAADGRVFAFAKGKGDALWGVASKSLVVSVRNHARLQP